jgi:putative membrane protein
VNQAATRKAPFFGIVAFSLTASAFLFWLNYRPDVAQSTIGGEWVGYLPLLNGALNASSAICLVLGFLAIKRKARDVHQRWMQRALIFSALFLVSYLIYHALHGDTPFAGQGAVRPIYFFILISHILLSVLALPMVLSTFYLSWSAQFARHRKLARFTFPIWLYVSVTGVMIVAMLRIWS